MERLLAEDCKFRPAAARLSTAPGGYTGAENQLYRVEVHDKGRAEAATFKWSRDNGSIIARVIRLTDLSHIEVQAVGSPELGFSSDDLVEVTDDARELVGLPGELRRIKAIDAVSGAVTLDAPLNPGLFPIDQSGAPDMTRHTRVRRWQDTGVIQGPSNWIDLENGIAVHFDNDPADGCFRTGDYWSFRRAPLIGQSSRSTELHRAASIIILRSLPSSRRRVICAICASVPSPGLLVKMKPLPAIKHSLNFPNVFTNVFS